MKIKVTYGDLRYGDFVEDIREFDIYPKDGFYIKKVEIIYKVKKDD